jgi:hypothetical protein
MALDGRDFVPGVWHPAPESWRLRAMTVRPYVTFEDARTPAEATRIAAGWPARPSREIDPDDYDPDTWDVAPPGRELAEDIVRALQTGALTLAFPVSRWEAYGWEFTVEIGGRKVWFMLQASDQWLLITDTPRRFWEKLMGATSGEQHGKALAILALFLVPPRFTNVRWFTKDEFRAHERGRAAP